MNALFTHFFDDLWTCRKWSIQIIGIAIFIVKHIDHGGNMAIVYCNLKLINFWTNRNSKLTSFFIMLLYGFYNQKEAKKGDENHYAKV